MQRKNASSLLVCSATFCSVINRKVDGDCLQLLYCNINNPHNAQRIVAKFPQMGDFFCAELYILKGIMALLPLVLAATPLIMRSSLLEETAVFASRLWGGWRLFTAVNGRWSSSECISRQLTDAHVDQ